MVDDNPVNQHLVVRLLEKRGFEVVAAGDGPAALDALETGRFDLVLMDVQMPGLDGLETTRELRRREGTTGGRLPVIAVTANALKGDDEICYRAGMDAYLAKPICPDALFSTIEQQLSASDASRASRVVA